MRKWCKLNSCSSRFALSLVAATPSKVRGCRRGWTGCKVTCPGRKHSQRAPCEVWNQIKSDHLMMIWFWFEMFKFKFKLQKALQILTTFLLSYPQSSLESKYLCVRCVWEFKSGWDSVESTPFKLTCGYFFIGLLVFPDGSCYFQVISKQWARGLTSRLWEVTWQQDLAWSLPHTRWWRP